MSIDDLPVEQFTAKEWRDIAVSNHEAKTHYFERMMALRDEVESLRHELETTLEVLSACKPG
jgi:hypothetical protein